MSQALDFLFVFVSSRSPSPVTADVGFVLLDVASSFAGCVSGKWTKKLAENEESISTDRP